MEALPGQHAIPFAPPDRGPDTVTEYVVYDPGALGPGLPVVRHDAWGIVPLICEECLLHDCKHVRAVRRRFQV